MRTWFGVALLLGLPAGAAAQSFDCAKARTPAERAICTQPALGALDRAVAGAYAAALARPDADAAALRTGQLAWLRSRDAGCGPATRGRQTLDACLTAAMNSRLAALAPAAAPAQAAQAPPAATPAPIPPASPPQAAAPTSAVPLPQPVPAAAPPLPPPSIPANLQPPAEATLDQSTLPATAPGSTLLHVRTAGRFSLRARSASGAALQLVDMMTGPADPVGEPGVQDGHTDVLLDAGTYKLRVTPAKDATGTVALDALPFRDAAPPAAIPAPGETASFTLQDVQQRAFWLQAGPDGELRIEAAGRALADLRLWRGGDLVPLQPDSQLIEPVRGHPMQRLALAGTVEPGTYLLVAYGGPAPAWADGDPAMPLHVRAGAGPRLAEGWASGTVGPLGSEVFAAPARANLFRLDLPESAPAQLRVDGQSASIAANSREPAASLRTGVNRRLVTVSGAAGQPYGLRAMEAPTQTSLSGPGRYWVSAVMPGAGGEEVPPTVLLLRDGASESGRILASNVPPVGPASGWRTVFNLRGPTTLLLDNTDTGELQARAVNGTGLLRVPPRAATLPAGIAEYRVAPQDGKQGVADLLFGAVAAGGAAAPRWPADPVVPLGIQDVYFLRGLQLVANTAPGLTPGLLGRPVPVALAEGPLVVSQMPGAPLTIPIQVAPGGTLAVGDPAVGDLPIPFISGASGVGDLVLPAPDRPRTVVLAWRQPPVPRAAIPAPPPRATVAALAPGAPRFLDLNDGGSRSFDLTVPDGGLYRVETTGRMHTVAAIGTAFVPALDQAETNGPGGNALLQRWLRAGRYRVQVTARDSAGHLGVRAAPAPLRDTAPLSPGGTLRAALPAGEGLAVPLEIAEAGRYRLTLLAPGRTPNARLDDAEGWPLTVPGGMSELEQDLPAGRLRLILAPDATGFSVLARLQRVLPPPTYEGHGPHALPFEAPAAATWREPAGRGDPRAPDRWTFALSGPADATLRISDGMAADLFRDGADKPVLRLVGPAPVRARLDAGQYRLDAASLGRNDRLDYTLSLRTAQLQPGVPRPVAPDAQVPFALAEPGVVSLTSFGPLPVKAVLRDGAGAVLGRYGARGADWNIAVSRPLPAGSYRLDLAPAIPPGLSDVTPGGNSRAAGDDSTGDPDDAQPQTAPSRSDDAGGGAAATDTPDTPDSDGPKVELTLALPPIRATVPAPQGTATLDGGGVHRLSLPQPQPGTLVLAAARSAAPAILAIERQRGDAWDILALDEGTAPVVAVPADADPAAWRVSAWAVGGGTLPIAASATVLARPAAPLDGLQASLVDAATPLAVALARLDGPMPVRLDGAPDGMLAGGWPGHPLTSPDGGTAVPQGAALWVVVRAAGPVRATVLRAVPGEAVALPVPAGGAAHLAAPAPAPGTLRAWRADAGLGQPMLDAGGGGGIARGSALSLGPQPVRVWAGDGDAIRPSITLLDLQTLPARRLDAAAALLLPPRSALSLTLPDGTRRTDLALAPGTAAVMDGATAWAGDDALSRSWTGTAPDLLLLNTGAQPAPVSVAWISGVPTLALQPGTVLKRFIGAAGSFELPVEAPAGARLRLAGDAQATFTGTDGRVLRQDAVLAGPGRVTVRHAPGLVALWLDVPGQPAWPAVDPVPQPLPARIPLSGPAMALSLPADTPVLLRVRTTAPVILAFGDGPPAPYPAGATLGRYLAAPTVLRIDSPQDGPLSGTLELAADPVTEIADGLGAPVALAPGTGAAFAFQLARGGDVGVGVRADPDRAEVRLLAADGTVLGEGAAMLRHLPAGRYVLDARLPADAPPTVLRPAVVGIAPRPSGPPPDVVRGYLELVGLAPKDSAR